MNDPLIEFKTLFENNWNTSNTVLSSMPNIHTGWYQSGSSEPQVTITNPEEQEASGSQSRWTAIKGDGTGPTRRTDGVVLSNVWCNEDQTSMNPKQVTWSLRCEVQRIVLNNVGSTQYDYIALGNIQQLIEDSQSPVMFRYEIPIGYQYEQEATMT